jgi:hypothetical protein
MMGEVAQVASPFFQNQKRNRMKKTILALIAIVSLIAMAAYAVDPAGLTSIQGLQPTAATGTVTNSGTGWLQANYEGNHLILVNMAGLAATNNFTLRIQDSSNGTNNWTNQVTIIPPSTNAQVFSQAVNLRQYKAYVRVSMESTANVTVGVNAVAQSKY